MYNIIYLVINILVKYENIIIYHEQKIDLKLDLLKILLLTFNHKNS